MYSYFFYIRGTEGDLSRFARVGAYPRLCTFEYRVMSERDSAFCHWRRPVFPPSHKCRPFVMSDRPKVLTAATDDEVFVRVRSREGDEVTWTQQASCLAGTLRNWMSTTDDETPFPTDIPAPALCMLKAVCTHAGSTPAPILSSCSLDELMAVMSAANFLEADDAFRAGARQVHHPQRPAQTSSNHAPKDRPSESRGRTHAPSLVPPLGSSTRASSRARASRSCARCSVQSYVKNKACTAGQRRPSGLVGRGWPGLGAAWGGLGWPGVA